MKKLSLSSFIPYIPFVVFFALFLVFLQPIELLAGTDDTAHFDKIDELGIFGWIGLRAETWQPRLISDFFYAVFIYKLELWKVVNAVIAGLLVFGIWRVAVGPEYLDDLGKTSAVPRRRALLLTASAICIIFFFIYPNAVTAASIWYTGSFNYLWPVTAMIFGLTPFIFLLRGSAPYPKKIWIPLSIAASIYACFTEQTALVSIGISALIFIYSFIKKNKIPVSLLIHFAIAFIVAVYYLYSVLTSPRMSEAAEIELFEEYATFGLRDKLQLGIHVFDTHILRASNLIFLTLALLAGLLANVRLKTKNPFFRTIAFFPAFYALINILPFRFIMNGVWQHPNHYEEIIGMPSGFDPNPAEWFNYLRKVPPMGWGLEPHDIFLAWLAFAAVIFMLYPLFFAFKEKKSGLLACFLYLAAYGSGAMMGFSPTVFDSGSRPFFLANIIILLLCTMLIKEGMLSEEPRISDHFRAATKVSRLALTIASIIAIYAVFLYKYVFASVYYWWF